MRHKWMSNTALCVLAAALTGPSYAQAAKPDANSPCNQVESACKSAGFVDGAKEGNGLWSDCIEPVMQGHPVSKGAKPLPRVDDKVVAACHAKEPTFGEPKKADANSPCNQVESACKSAGFVDGAKEGKGLWSDCIGPVMQGHPVSKGAKPLPRVDDKVVAACHAKDPTFGETRKAKPK
jgi:hypothetical protein